MNKKQFFNFFLLTILSLYVTLSIAEDGKQIVIAEGLGAVITDQELQAEMDYLLSKQPILGVPSLTTVERISKEMLTNKQLMNEAIELGLQNDPQIEFEIRRSKERILIKARMAKFDAEGLSESDLLVLAKEYWHTHQDEYTRKPERALSHILIGLKKRSDAEASAIAEKLYAELVESPHSFEAMVEKYSEDPGSKKKKGSLGLSTRDRFVAEFSQAAFSLKEIGELSKPVKTRFGYHIIRLDEVVEEKLRSFDEVKDDAMEKARAAYVKSKQQQHLNYLQASKNRTVNKEEIRQAWEKMFPDHE